jgi:hypothetical protein
MNFIEAVKAYKDGNVVIRTAWPRSETNGSGEECVYFWSLRWDNGMRSIKYVRRGNRYERASDTARDPIFPSEILENDWVVWNWKEWKEADDEFLRGGTPV